ncbi:MAG TPA: YigZ family protein [Bacteroidales bacterium]|nr:YigZ family protein [Bacteroidales bacterium]
MSDLFNNDLYKTISRPSEGLYKDKGSKFIAFAYPVTGQEEIKAHIERTRKEYHDARHHCYAWMLGHDRLTYRVNDDGEPSGTAGKPILGQINSHNLTNILIIVTRYFGGTLLGVSGLINAYRSAAFSCIQNAQIVEKALHDYYLLSFGYNQMNDVMRVLKEENISQSDQVFDTQCSLTVNFRLSAKDKVLAKFSRIEGLEVKYIQTR